MNVMLVFMISYGFIGWIIIPSFISPQIFIISPDAAGAVLLRAFEDLAVKVGLWVQLVVRLRWIDLDVFMLASDMPLQGRLRTVKLPTISMRTAISEHQILRFSSLSLGRDKQFSTFRPRNGLKQVQHHPLLGPGIRKPFFDPLLLLSESQVRPAPFFLAFGEDGRLRS